MRWTDAKNHLLKRWLKPRPAGPAVSPHSAGNLKVDAIETRLGNHIIQQLQRDGWKTHRQYPPLAFDKGIDYDQYTLRKHTEELHFTWTNWFEWEIEGSEQTIGELIQRFRL